MATKDLQFIDSYHLIFPGSLALTPVRPTRAVVLGRYCNNVI